MKYLLIALFAAALLALGIEVCGNPLDGGALLAIAFSSCLIAWVVRDGDRSAAPGLEMPLELVTGEPPASGSAAGGVPAAVIASPGVAAPARSAGGPVPKFSASAST